MFQLILLPTESSKHGAAAAVCTSRGKFNVLISQLFVLLSQFCNFFSLHLVDFKLLLERGCWQFPVVSQNFDEILSVSHTVPALKYLTLRSKMLSREVQTESILLWQEESSLSCRIPARCSHKNLHVKVADVNQVVSLPTTANYEWEFLLIETWQWTQPILVCISNIRLYDFMQDLPVVNDKKIS